MIVSSANTQPLAIYVHWPYCLSKCPYCDFNSHVAATIDHAVWADTYMRELRHYAALLPDRRVTSIFFGGGTPSLMEVSTVETVLGTIADLWPLSDDIEITLEANPTSVEAEKFAGFRTAGVNRVSLGIQALRDADLKFLGRTHDTDQARQAIALAKKYFPRWSFDLIYARKDQTPQQWQDELREALQLADGHLSLYQLTIEPNTQFYTLSARGEKLTATDDNAAIMYEATQDVLRNAGLPAYEISNHARLGQESRHNLTYWRYQDYIGIGPGAHGRFHDANSFHSTENHRSPDVWTRQVLEKNQGLKLFEPLDTATAQREAMMMGLRLTTGIDRRDWQNKFDQSLNDFLPLAKRARLIDEGYLVADTHNLRATHSGLQRLNAVLNYLLN
jgi:oxygen-independent coproporphyrinogen-3 oxidase